MAASFHRHFLPRDTRDSCLFSYDPKALPRSIELSSRTDWYVLQCLSLRVRVIVSLFIQHKHTPNCADMMDVNNLFTSCEYVFPVFSCFGSADFVDCGSG